LVNWNSGNPDETEEAVLTRYLPLLALGTVSLPMLFVVVWQHAPGDVILNVLVYFLLALFILWGTLAGETGLLKVAAILSIVVVPTLCVLAGLRVSHTLMAFGGELCLSSIIAWTPAWLVLEIAGEQIARLHGDVPEEKTRKRRTVKLSTAVMLAVGTLLFVAGTANASGQVSDLFIVTFFAVPFYLCAFALISLQQLFLRAADLPRPPITVSADFIRQWSMAILPLLLVAALLALLIPKEPLHYITSRLPWQTLDSPFAGFRPAWPDLNPFSSERGDSPSPGVPKPNGQPAPTGKDTTNKQSALGTATSSPDGSSIAPDGDDAGDGAGDASEKDTSAVWAAANKSIDAVRAVSRTGEPAQPPSPHPHKKLVSKADARRNFARLRRELHDHPWRLVKLVVFTLLLLAALTVGIVLWRRRAQWRRAQAAARAARIPWRDPFTDPFTTMPDAATDALVRAVYESFLAYLWVGGHRHKRGQTEFEFATWLENGSPLDPLAIWTITRQCTRAYYAQSDLTPTDRRDLQLALTTLIRQAIGKLSAEELAARQQQFLAGGGGTE
jgi:hypothetical protein